MRVERAFSQPKHQPQANSSIHDWILAHYSSLWLEDVLTWQANMRLTHKLSHQFCLCAKTANVFSVFLKKTYFVWERKRVWKGRRMRGIKGRYIWFYCINFDHLLTVNCPWVQHCFISAVLHQRTAFQNLSPELSTMPLNHWVISLGVVYQITCSFLWNLIFNTFNSSSM